MKISKVGFLIFLSIILAGARAPSAAHAEEIVLRKAATPTSPGPRYQPAPDETRQASSKTRIGLTPTPYEPEMRDPEPSQHVIRAANFPDIRELIKRVNKSVVSIRMLEPGSSFSLGHLGFSHENGGKAMGYGSGFIISSNGHIITNEHVLRNGSQIEVELLDGRKYMAKPVHKDSKNDVALLKIDAGGLYPVSLGDSEAVELGEWVVGIGNPYGIGQSIMIGIVSAQKRSIPGSGYPPLIQIDAAMNLGNSGGPLFNMDGQVVGINTILLWKSQGIGFATPINSAKEFLQKRNYHMVKVAPATAQGPLGPAADQPRTASERFNPLDPPWRFAR
jgi:S1-C subfamily serine protease